MTITKGKGKITHANIGMCDSLPTLKPMPTPMSTPMPTSMPTPKSTPSPIPNPPTQCCPNISNLENLLIEMKQSTTDEREELDMKIKNLENQLSGMIDKK